MSEPERPSWRGALADLLPRDADVILLARPRELAHAPASHRVVAALVSDEKLDSYRQHTGIDPREIEELAWASASSGSVLMVRGPFAAPLAVAEMGARMVPLEASADEPFVRRAGFYQGARRDLIAIDDHVLVAITGTPEMAQALLARVRGEDTTGGPLARRDLASMLEEQGGAPVVLVAPRHLAIPPGSGIALLLAREEALVGTLAPSGAETLAFTVELRGEFPPGADANFRQLVASLAETDLGAALGMRDLLATLTVQTDDGRVLLRASVPAAAVAAGLRVLFDAEIAELVGTDAPSRPSDEAGISR